MFGEYGLTFALAGGVGVALIVGSTFTPVIPRGEGRTGSLASEAHAAEQYAFCDDTLDGVDCACFAGRAGQVMSHEALEIRGAETINRTELARMQAMESC